MKHRIALLIIAAFLMVASFYLLYRTESLYDTLAPVFTIIICSILIIGKEKLDLYIKNNPESKISIFFKKYSIYGTGWSWGDVRDGYIGLTLGLIAGYVLIIAISLV